MEKMLSKYFIPDKTFSLAEYEQDGGYEAAKTMFVKFADPKLLVEEVKKSNLRGLGGAGFPPGMKWSLVPQNTGKPVYLVVNADEGEPGTFKDKYIIRHNPHLLLEGIMIAAYANNVHKAYIYIRGEYTQPWQKLMAAVQECYDKGYFGKKIFGRDFELEVVVHRGAGAYICGEETGLLESLEGKKGFPRLKPPFPAVVGLFGCPTVINNVETMACVPHILKNGAEWFAKRGPEHRFPERSCESWATTTTATSGRLRRRPAEPERSRSTWRARRVTGSPPWRRGMRHSTPSKRSREATRLSTSF